MKYLLAHAHYDLDYGADFDVTQVKMKRLPRARICMYSNTLSLSLCCSRYFIGMYESISNYVSYFYKGDIFNFSRKPRISIFFCVFSTVELFSL